MKSLFRSIEELLDVPVQQKSELRRNGTTIFLKRSVADLAKRADRQDGATSSTSRPAAPGAPTIPGISGPPVARVILRKARSESS